MKKLITLAAALTIMLTAPAVWATEQDGPAEDDCRAMAVEQNIPEDEVEQFVADCLADLAKTESGEQNEEAPVKE